MEQRDLSPAREPILVPNEDYALCEGKFFLSKLAKNQQTGRIFMSKSPGRYTILRCTEELRISICVIVHVYAQFKTQSSTDEVCLVEEHDMIFWQKGTCDLALNRLKCPSLTTNAIERDYGGNDVRFFLWLELYSRDPTAGCMKMVASLRSNSFIAVSHSKYASNHRRRNNH